MDCLVLQMPLKYNKTTNSFILFNLYLIKDETKELN